MSTNLRYQGYPYVSPPVVEALSISADDAARWSQLPRRQNLDLTKEPAELPDKGNKRQSNTAPVVYIDLPEESDSYVADRQFPEDHDLEVFGSSSTNKQDLDAPVVYIDLPDATGSDVARSLETTPQEEPTFVQDTIFYNPFENRRIDCAKDESDDDSVISSEARTLARPNNLDLNGAGPSRGPTSYLSTTAMSSLITKETEIYGGIGNGFPSSPIPVSQFPEPPPAYTETAPSSLLVTEQPRSASPPKTEVIVPEPNSASSMGLPHSGRKLLECQHCNMRVHALLIKQNGIVAHGSALFCFIICCYPAIVFIYCTDFLKKRNHYCPNCNNIIAYEPALSTNNVKYLPKIVTNV